MSNYKAGEMIRLTRLSLKMSQETLSENICSVQTLSRIENGRHHVKNHTYQQLMERMGRYGGKSFCFFSMDNYSLLEILAQVNAALSRNAYQELKNYVQQLKPFRGNHVLNEQYICKNELIADYRLGNITKDTFLKELQGVVALTLPDHENLLERKYPFLYEELMIMMNLASAYRENENHQKSMWILSLLLQILETGYMERHKSTQVKITLMNNLAKVYGEMEDHQAAVHLSKEALIETKREKLVNMVPNLYFELAWNIKQQIEKGDRREDELSLCKKYLRQGYASAAISKKRYLQNAIEQYYRKCFHETIYVYSPSTVGEAMKD